MSYSSTDSHVSLAEEMTEEIHIVKEDYLLSEIEQICSSGSESAQIDDNLKYWPSNGDTAIYSPIKIEHVNIINLKVDSYLKPDYISNPGASAWLGKDLSIEEKKQKGILKFLSQERLEGRSKGILRTMSHDNVRVIDRLVQPWSKRGSIDDIARRRHCQWSESSGLTGGGGDDCDDGDDGEGRDEDECDLWKSGIMDELEFQTSLKNERFHFLFADMVMEGLEIMQAEEMFYQARRHHNQSHDNNSVPYCQPRWSAEPFDCSRLEAVDSQQCQFSCAKITAMAFLDSVVVMVATLTAHDGRHRDLSADLRSLLRRLREGGSSCMSSFSFSDKLSPPRKHSIKVRVCKQLSTANADSDCSQSAETVDAVEAKIKSAIGGLTVDIQVGGCPILGPDMSLPCYVASRPSPFTKRIATLFLQQNMCPGCKCSFLPEVARRLRLCDYFGLYFCSVCHSNTLMLIPARILTRWEFAMFPVSRPARDLLQLIHSAPLFSPSHFSKPLQASLAPLSTTSRLRRQGRLLLDFISACRQSSQHQLLLLSAQLPPHWLSPGPLLFSIADFRLMNSGSMQASLRHLVSSYVEHVSLCPLCQARGFICELCASSRPPEVIFPFEIDSVLQCPFCGACFHSACFKPPRMLPAAAPGCPRCERLSLRRSKMQQQQQLLEDTPVSP